MRKKKDEMDIFGRMPSETMSELDPHKGGRYISRVKVPTCSDPPCGGQAATIPVQLPEGFRRSSCGGQEHLPPSLQKSDAHPSSGKVLSETAEYGIICPTIDLFAIVHLLKLPIVPTSNEISSVT